MAHNFINTTGQNKFVGEFYFQNNVYEYILYLPKYKKQEIVNYFGTRKQNNRACLGVTKSVVKEYIENDYVSAFVIVNRLGSDEKASGTLQIYDHCSGNSPSTIENAYVWINDLCRIPGPSGEKTSSVDALLFFMEQLTVQNLKKTDIYLFVNTKHDSKDVLIQLYSKKGFNQSVCPINTAGPHMLAMQKPNLTANTDAIMFDFLRPAKSGGKRRKKTVRRKRRMKGGNKYKIINLTSSFTPEHLNTLFSSIDETKYDLVYISIGGKYNESTFTLYGKNITTNSSHQIIPFFVANPSKKVLCISIDQYADDSDIRNTLRTINNTYDSDIKNIDLFFVNTIEGRNEITRVHGYEVEPQSAYIANLVDTISQKIREKHMDPSSYMVCNYVKFKHPNPMEESLETLLTNNIYDALSKNGYENSYYNWCGYRKLIYYDYIMKGKSSVLPMNLPGVTDMNDREAFLGALTVNSNPEKNKNINSILQRIYPIVHPGYLFNFYDKDFDVPHATNNFVYNMAELKAYLNDS